MGRARPGAHWSQPFGRHVLDFVILFPKKKWSWEGGHHVIECDHGVHIFNTRTLSDTQAKRCRGYSRLETEKSDFMQLHERHAGRVDRSF